jgi:aldoxime dehydratase
VKLEPAIPPHLQVKRTQSLNAPPDFKPTVASYSARFAPTVKTLPMAYIGVQYKQASSDVVQAIDTVAAAFQSGGGPGFWDRAEYVDELGYTNAVLVGYWDSKDDHANWEAGLPRDWWHPGAVLDGEIGFFLECYTPSVADTETTYGHQYPEGYANLASHMSGPTDTHGYWGSARDRIARSQTDSLEAQGEPQVTSNWDGTTLGRHIVVDPHENLCLLRSGQDWTDVGPEERDFYLRDVKPSLDRGMRYIRDEGKAVGCYFNRYMTVVTKQGAVDKTYSLSAWHSLNELEAWVKTDSHLEIFAAGMKHYLTFAKPMLRLYHEMFVVRASGQHFEYFNCHQKTGMLNALNTRA